MEKERRIYCPRCNRHVADYDNKAKSNIEVRCKKCNVLVIFTPSNQETATKKMPERMTASGKRFY